MVLQEVVMVSDFLCFDRLLAWNNQTLAYGREIVKLAVDSQEPSADQLAYLEAAGIAFALVFQTSSARAGFRRHIS